MSRLTLIICWILIAVMVSGCTIHFKASEVELDAERQRVDSNRTYELEKVDLFRG